MVLANVGMHRAGIDRESPCGQARCRGIPGRGHGETCVTHMGPISLFEEMTGLTSTVIPRRLAAAGSRLAGGLGTRGCGEELLFAAFAAEVGGLSITFGMKGFGRVYGHPADGVFGHSFGLAHGHVPLLGCLDNILGIHRALLSGKPIDREDQQNNEQHTNHRPKPHPAAQPSIHVSGGLIHHGYLFMALKHSDLTTCLVMS